MTPYYQDESVTLYHGDAFTYMGTLPSESVDCVITDPPYTERTHTKARSVNRGVVTKGVPAFAHITDEDLTRVLEMAARVTRSWVIATLDYKHAVAYDIGPPKGLKMQRVGVWVKSNPTPQLTGDRPAQGWEAIAYMHRSDRRSKWNGGGKHGNYILPTAPPQGHPTSKPVAIVSDWVRLFTTSGGLVLDPFAGSGTTLIAAKQEGRRAIGVEIDERYCEIAARRLSQDVLFAGGVS